MFHNNNIKSIILVIIQFSSIFYIVFSGPNIALNRYLKIIEFTGILIGLWAIVVMMSSKLNVFPDVTPGTTLVQQGPYKLIRHPMYTAILLTFFPLVINYYSLDRLVVFLVLVFNLLVKISYEEKILLDNLKGYNEYVKRTSRIIPFLW